MADKQSIGKKWGSLKRAARGSVKNLGNSSPNPNKGGNFSSFDEEVDNDTANDEFGERQMSQEKIASITKVGLLIENFRLVCLQALCSTALLTCRIPTGYNARKHMLALWSHSHPQLCLH